MNKQLLQFFHPSSNQLEFGSVKYRLMYPESGLGLTDRQADWAIAQYLCFLMLFWLYPQANLVPNRVIDKVWHCHLLDTQKYMADCQLLFGAYVHHFPFYGLRGTVDQQQMYASFLQTQQLFSQHFGLDIMERSQQVFNTDILQPSGCHLPQNVEESRLSVPVNIDQLLSQSIA
ncbi:hypothetical protein A0J48_010310 [Sphaerospermopsis aphanizomenoides BCCUSP55]|uniref:glycine-rich domain-containing protein n=1 Tax=Sphaerospermopsis aphanizomenoides TaxID=459663 RepID=UPI00190516D1|nr:hypothetical protein [Sphaerospermopsis aphanizomenoides]MBK1987928.1 hypothetical protein [Sphaerospermopsis aphanizomenoides BCCUSP55]